ncbi:MAG: hypothetical protein ACQERR_06735 [Pseudomonadota bacterium]
MTSEPRYAEQGRLALWRRDWADWRGGNRARLWARRGYLRAPEGRSALLWVRAGPDPNEIRLAADLLGAIRRLRLDLRLVLTYEREFVEVLRERLEGVERERVALGHGPGGRGRWLERAVGRLQPRAVITVGHAPEPALARAVLNTGGEIRAFALDAGPPADGPELTAVTPVDSATAEAWRDRAGQVDAAADPRAVLAVAQVEPVLPAILGHERIAWFIGVSDWAELASAWTDHPLASDGVLFVTPAPGAEEPPTEWPRLSRWARHAEARGTVLVVDDPRWNAVVAASAEAIHVFVHEGGAFWQAMASHRPVTTAREPEADSAGRAPCPLHPATAAAGLAVWQEWHNNPSAASELGRNCRHYFWAVRRQAQANIDGLLQRIDAW